MVADGADEDMVVSEAALGQGEVGVAPHAHNQVLLHLCGGQTKPARTRGLRRSALVGALVRVPLPLPALAVLVLHLGGHVVAPGLGLLPAGVQGDVLLPEWHLGDAGRLGHQLVVVHAGDGRHVERVQPLLLLLVGHPGQRDEPGDVLADLGARVVVPVRRPLVVLAVEAAEVVARPREQRQPRHQRRAQSQVVHGARLLMEVVGYPLGPVRGEEDVHPGVLTVVPPQRGLQTVEALHGVVVALGAEPVLGLHPGDVGHPQPLLGGEAALSAEVDQVVAQLRAAEVGVGGELVGGGGAEDVGGQRHLAPPGLVVRPAQVARPEEGAHAQQHLERPRLLVHRLHSLEERGDVPVNISGHQDLYGHFGLQYVNRTACDSRETARFIFSEKRM